MNIASSTSAMRSTAQMARVLLGFPDMGKPTREERRRTFEKEHRSTMPRARRAREDRGEERSVSPRAWVVILVMLAVLVSVVVAQAFSPLSIHASASVLIDRLLPPVR